MISFKKERNYMLFFFFSSRRRHTRFSRDWSSDVCSSDLAGSDLHAQGLHGLQDLLGAADASGGSVERGEEPIAGRVDLAATVSREQAPHERVVSFNGLGPRAVAELRRRLGRARDVGEEHGREHAVEL